MKPLTARNVSVEDLFDMLGEQKARQVDVVVKATDLTATPDGHVLVDGHEQIMNEYGVTPVNGKYRPNDVFQGHLAERFSMGTRYTRKMAAERPDIWASNLNGWVHGSPDPRRWDVPDYPVDGRSFLLRAYSGGNDGTDNVARALLSDSYNIIDNIDVVAATLKGIQGSAADGQIVVSGADLSDRRMFIRFLAPTIHVGAQALLDGYRSPFRPGGAERVGRGGWQAPEGIAEAARQSNQYGDGTVVWAGFEVGNSEVGAGAYTVTPRAEIRTCLNGLKIVADMEREIHLGAKLEHGVIKWSEETQRAQLSLIEKKTADAVRTFLDPAYWEAKVAELAAKAGRPVADAPKAIERLAKPLGYSEAERNAILNHFVLGGQLTAGGVMNAVTSVAQTVPDADRAAELEGTAVRVLDLV
jgi:hypothetical protein